MRRVTAGALAIALLFSASASAEGLANLIAGTNALITAPADPVMATVTPPEEFGKLWGNPVTGHTLGFFAGIAQSGQRLFLGICDIAFFPFWVFPTLSPEPRWQVIPGEVEYEY